MTHDPTSKTPERKPAPPVPSPATTTPPSRPARSGRRDKARNETLRIFGALGIVGVGAAVGAILGAADVDAWIIGLVVAVVALALGLVLRRSLPL